MNTHKEGHKYMLYDDYASKNTHSHMHAQAHTHTAQANANINRSKKLLTHMALMHVVGKYIRWVINRHTCTRTSLAAMWGS